MLKCEPWCCNISALWLTLVIVMSSLERFEQSACNVYQFLGHVNRYNKNIAEMFIPSAYCVGHTNEIWNRRNILMPCALRRTPPTCILWLLVAYHLNSFILGSHVLSIDLYTADEQKNELAPLKALRYKESNLNNMTTKLLSWFYKRCVKHHSMVSKVW